MSKPHLASLKHEVNEIDEDNSKALPVSSSKLCNVVDNDIGVAKTVYDQFSL